MRKTTRQALMAAAFLAATLGAQANNITISNVTLLNAGSQTVDVQFDVTWDNPFSATDANGETFSDMAWIFVKYWVTGVDDEESGWHPATLVPGGTLTPTTDRRGAVADIGANQTVRWNFAADGVARDATVEVNVGAIEVVRVPEGQFTYNAGNAGGTIANNFGDGVQTLVDDTGDIPTGAAAGWPNGYSAFYIAKYEMSQQQYSDFLNLLDTDTAQQRYMWSYNSAGQRIDYNGASAYGVRYFTSAGDRAANYVGWYDALAYTSWCSMRPMTEMEFEKAARGGGATPYIYPWGNNAPPSTTYTPPETGTHKKLYANWSASTPKPLRVGHYLTEDVKRTKAETGASPYGIVDLGGNVWETIINCAHLLVPAHGDGTTVYPPSWPPAGTSKGNRGGSQVDSSTVLPISYRGEVNWSSSGRDQDLGCRPGRSVE